MLSQLPPCACAPEDLLHHQSMPSICCEPKAASTWAESLEAPETTGQQAAGTISRG